MWVYYLAMGKSITCGAIGDGCDGLKMEQQIQRGKNSMFLVV